MLNSLYIVACLIISDCQGYLGTLPCDSYKCKNRGECVEVKQSPYCNCTTSYNGEHCEIEVPIQNPCRNFCYNNGICQLDLQQRPSCICIGQWRGQRCEQPPPCLDQCGECHPELDSINECL